MPWVWLSAPRVAPRDAGTAVGDDSDVLHGSSLTCIRRAGRVGCAVGCPSPAADGCTSSSRTAQARESPKEETNASRSRPALKSRWEVKVVPTPEPGPNQVLIKLHASGLCFTDVHQTNGELLGPFPRILGHEPVGEIVALGAGVHSRKVGTASACPGSSRPAGVANGACAPRRRGHGGAPRGDRELDAAAGEPRLIGGLRSEDT